MAADADEQSSAEEGRAGLNGHADVQGNADNSNIAPWPGATYSSPSELSEPLLPTQRQKEESGRHNVEHYAHFEWDSDDEGATEYQGPSDDYVTGVRRKEADGSEEQWDARRHRRNLMPRRRDRYGNVKSPDAKNPFSLSRRYVYSDTKAYNELRRISFFVGPAFLVSSALFGVGNFAKEFPGYFKGEWSPALQDRFVNMPYLIGSIAFLIGAYCSVLECANVDYRHKTKLWHDGDRMQEPRLNFLTMPRARHDFLSFHGAFLSFTGAWLYIFGSAIQLIGSHVQLTQMQKMLFTAAPFLIGAILFTAGGYLMAVEAAHSWTWAFTPPKFGTYESKTPGRWIQVLTLYGSVLYVAGGVLCFVQNMLSVREYQVFNGCTFALGTCIIFAHAVLQTVEWFCPQL